MTSDCVMELLSLQVGSNKVSAVIQSVCKNLFDVEIQPKDPPSRKTVERIVAEGRLLSLCQSAEVLLEILIAHYIWMELVETTEK